MNFQQLPELTTHAEKRLRVCGDPALWDAVKSDLKFSNAALLYSPEENYLVLRADTQENELVILACTGKNASDIMRECIGIARLNGLESIRFHTSKRGLARLVKEFKPVEIERVYRIYLDEN